MFEFPRHGTAAREIERETEKDREREISSPFAQYVCARVLSSTRRRRTISWVVALLRCIITRRPTGAYRSPSPSRRAYYVYYLYHADSFNRDNRAESRSEQQSDPISITFNCRSNVVSLALWMYLLCDIKNVKSIGLHYVMQHVYFISFNGNNSPRTVHN